MLHQEFIGRSEAAGLQIKRQAPEVSKAVDIASGEDSIYGAHSFAAKMACLGFLILLPFDRSSVFKWYFTDSSSISWEMSSFISLK